MARDLRCVSQSILLVHSTWNSAIKFQFQSDAEHWLDLAQRDWHASAGVSVYSNEEGGGGVLTCKRKISFTSESGANRDVMVKFLKVREADCASRVPVD